MTSLFDFSATRLDGSEEPLSAYHDRVVLVVNVASKCGFTPQYAGLEALWREYAVRGLVILGFPCNQFGAQEPGSSDEIAAFCSTTYEVSFPMFGRIEVNGDSTHPLYRWLKSAEPGILGTEAIKWNFTKFLVDRAGRPVARFAPTVKPDELRPRIEALL